MRRSAGRTLILSVLAAATAACPACRSRSDRCGDPVAAAGAFVEAMETGDREAALALLSAAARDELGRAAAEASATAGQAIGPADLLVPERSVLAHPGRLRLKAAAGNAAFVEQVTPDAGEAGEPEPGGIQRLVLEGGCWRVDLFAEPP